MNNWRPGLISYLFILLLPLSLFSGTQPLASLSKFVGQVEYQRHNSAAWKLVELGMFFYEKDKLKTDIEGQAELFFADGTELYISKLTKFEFQELTKEGSKKKRILFLTFGKLWSKVVSGTLFDIETTNAVASVKGTDFGVSMTADDMEVVVLDGLVEIANDFGKVLAEKNTKTSVTRGKEPAKVKVKPEAIKRMEEVKILYTLALSAVGKLLAGDVFEIKSYIKDKTTDKLADVPIKLTWKAGTEGLQFSTDKEKWVSELESEYQKGHGSIFVRALSSGTHELAVFSSKFSGKTLQVKVAARQGPKTIILRFKDKNNAINEIRMKYDRPAAQ